MAYPVLRPVKRQRRTATAVLAGDFDERPQRDVLTSLLNGVGIYSEVENKEDIRRERKRERRERERERKRVQKLQDKAARAAQPAAQAPSDKARGKLPDAPASAPAASSFWRARPAIHIASMQRSVSITPPPMPPSPSVRSLSTPDQDDDATTVTSRTSSKRPRTPDDDESLLRGRGATSSAPPATPRQRKKRQATRKGWKGWVEGSPPPSEKLINLDSVVVLHERKTRSGKNFDGIGEGVDGWI